MLLRHLFLLILICFLSQKAFSQKAFCDTIAFRGQTICLENVELKSLSGEFEDRDEEERVRNVTIYHLDFYDSVVVKFDTVLFSTFLTQGITKIISPWIIYEDRGTIVVDSFYQTSGSKEAYGRGYFGLFRNRNHPFTTWNKKENSNKYYSFKGVDSANVFRYPNGITQEIDDWNDNRRLFYKSGRLHYKIDIRRDTVEYYPNGITVKMSVKHWNSKTGAINIRCEYYKNGAIRSKAFYSKNKYFYYTSEYYSEDGKLLKKDYRKMPRSFYPRKYNIIAAPPPDQIFLTVIQEPEYQGGWRAFQQRLKQLLYKIDGEGWDNLMFYGHYIVNADVDSLGNFTATKVQGGYAPDIFLKYMNYFFFDIRWKPYKLNGRGCKASYSFSIKVSGQMESLPYQR